MTMSSDNWENVSSSTSLTLLVEKEATQSATHSVPWSKPTLNNKKPSLKRVQALDECVRFLKDMAKELQDVSKVRQRSRTEREKDVLGKSNKPNNMDQSKSLIQSWAKEVNSLNLVSRVTKRAPVQEVSAHRVKDVSDSSKEMCLTAQSDRIMEWARELQTVSESLGVKDEDLQHILSDHSRKHSELDRVLPFLEFVVWSLLSQRSEEDISNTWLSVKQREWRTGSQKYIPRSVWQWIQSASADVHLDPSSCHPWLCVSEDKREVHEQNRPQHQQDNHQRFDELSCVLGLNSFYSGRHYWEVSVPTNGSWKLGVASASSPRKGKFQMTPETGYWIIYNGPKSLWACTKPQTKLLQCLQPQVVGVYVDYNEGQVSFYDATRRFHIYTFTQLFEEALFPVFVCLDGNTVLKIQTSQTSE